VERIDRSNKRSVGERVEHHSAVGLEVVADECRIHWCRDPGCLTRCCDDGANLSSTIFRPHHFLVKIRRDCGETIACSMDCSADDDHHNPPHRLWCRCEHQCRGTDRTVVVRVKVKVKVWYRCSRFKVISLTPPKMDGRHSVTALVALVVGTAAHPPSNHGFGSIPATMPGFIQETASRQSYQAAVRTPSLGDLRRMYTDLPVSCEVVVQVAYSSVNPSDRFPTVASSTLPHVRSCESSAIALSHYVLVCTVLYLCWHMPPCCITLCVCV
jgi:hypothetical protein